MSTEKLVKFVVETSYDELPKEAVDNAKKCILDGLGVAVAGSAEPAGRIITE